MRTPAASGAGRGGALAMRSVVGDTAWTVDATGSTARATATTALAHDAQRSRWRSTAERCSSGSRPCMKPFRRFSSGQAIALTRRVRTISVCGIPMAPPLVDVYLALGGPGGAAMDRDVVASGLARAIARGRAAWPTLALDDRTFVEHLATRVAPGDLDSARAEDLWLACACARGVAGAVEAFDHAHASDVQAVHAQARPPKPALDELQQVVRTKLFVGPTAKIAEYSGLGPLRNWVRVLGA